MSIPRLQIHQPGRRFIDFVDFVFTSTLNVYWSLRTTQVHGKSGLLSRALETKMGCHVFVMRRSAVYPSELLVLLVESLKQEMIETNKVRSM